MPRAFPSGPPDAALILSRPGRVLTAERPDEIPGLLAEVEAEQLRGRYVAGYLAYEAGAAFGHTVQPPGPEALPLAWMAVYEEAAATLMTSRDWSGLLDGFDASLVARALAATTPELSVSRDQYVEAIRRVREYIAAGDTYQVNYTVRGRFDLATGRGAGDRGAADREGAEPDPIDPLDYFLALVIRQQVPYAAYFDLGDAQVVSLSPEMFLRRDGRRLESRPMKGTRPRGLSHVEDVALAYELTETEKERAENLMIVDMVRNDLGRVCRAGSVRVPTLYAVEPYRTVWQMVSTVVGDVNPRAGLGDIMQAVFPGASITGAPKHHTMEIIAELETEPRDVYTGAVSLFCPGGDFTCNIAIRTIVHRQGRCRLGTGSGVVWDADPGAEYEETLTKATFATPPAVRPGDADGGWRPDPGGRLQAALRGSAAAATAVTAESEAGGSAEGVYLFETILLGAREGDATQEYPHGLAGLSPSLALSDAAVLARFLYLDGHLARMAASAAALGLAFDDRVAREVLLGLARINPDAMVVRVELDAAAQFSLSTRPVPHPPATPTVSLLISPFRTDPEDPFLAHKTSVRGFYNREHRRAQHRGCFDALFVNRLDRVTEGAVTSIFARFDDRWVTPPLGDGLLPGIWRAAFLTQTGGVERSLYIEDLLAADEIVVGNSVRGAIPVGELIADPVTF